MDPGFPVTDDHHRGSVVQAVEAERRTQQGVGIEIAAEVRPWI